MDWKAKGQLIFSPTDCIPEAELRAYAKDQLNGETLRRVEVHLADCEFCSEALEGFALQPNPNSVLEIKNVVFDQGQKNKPDWTFRAAAAAVVILIGVGLGFFFSNGEKENSLASNEVKPSNMEAEIAPVNPPIKEEIKAINPIPQSKDQEVKTKIQGPSATAHFKKTETLEDLAAQAPEETALIPPASEKSLLTEPSFSETKNLPVVPKMESIQATSPVTTSGQMITRQTPPIVQEQKKSKTPERAADAAVQTTTNEDRKETDEEERLTKGKNLYNQGKYNEAIQIFGKLRKSQFRSIADESLYYMALSLVSKGDSVTGISLLEKIGEDDGPFRKAARDKLGELGE